MTIAEVRAILAILVTALDRPVADGLDQIWAHALADIPYDLGRQAALDLIKTSVFMPKVAELRARAQEIDRERRRQARELREQEETERLAIERGPVRDRSAEVTELVRTVVAALPVTPSDAIHERAKARARREKGRPDKPTARERPAKRKPKDWPPPATDDIAALATRYLLDGHEPMSVADRLGVSRRWCRDAISRFRSA